MSIHQLKYRAFILSNILCWDLYIPMSVRGEHLAYLGVHITGHLIDGYMIIYKNCGKTLCKILLTGMER